MSTQLLLIIIGSLLILVGIVGGKRTGDPAQELVNANIRIPLGVIGTLIIIFVGYFYGTIKPVGGQHEHIYVGNKLKVDFPVEEVKVISPVDGDQVECRILTMGVYPDSMEKDIWVVLRPTDNRYYPQSDHTNVSYRRNGKWQVITRFGGDKDEKFELIVYKTDDAASAFFSTTIQKWKDQLSYPGLDLTDIPETAVEVDRLNLSLNGHCRGLF